MLTTNMGNDEMRRLSYYFLMITILVGCTRKLESFVLKEFNGSTQKDDSICVIDFSKLTDFEWDTLYFFSAGYDYAVMELPKNPQLPYHEYSDYYVFFNKDRLVYYEIISIPYPGDWYLIKPREPIITNSASIFKIGKDNALFFVKKISKRSFRLTPKYYIDLIANRIKGIEKYSLKKLGKNNFAYTKESALKIITNAVYLEHKPILGVDVYLLNDSTLTTTQDKWIYDDVNNLKEGKLYIENTLVESMEFICNFETKKGIPLFTIQIDME